MESFLTINQQIKFHAAYMKTEYYIVCVVQNSLGLNIPPRNAYIGYNCYGFTLYNQNWTQVDNFFQDVSISCKHPC